jgi:hypothetical protein
LALPKTANPLATQVQAIKLERPAWADEVDDILGPAEDYERKVHTKDLPNTQDFGGAQALVDLQSEIQEYDENSSESTKN